MDQFMVGEKVEARTYKMKKNTEETEAVILQ